ncbi:unnamed protein product [Caenorhabditis auriculariae]|uniref:Uncharacterized protein n=1 Tax=Caenorhabditis auriculariae TaxID=2777116 RepID=A0A8S1HU85_9PELO|nr:unnamed protein product [Caenorhabditis auriculariae]
MFAIKRPPETSYLIVKRKSQEQKIASHSLERLPQEQKTTFLARRTAFFPRAALDVSVVVISHSSSSGLTKSSVGQTPPDAVAFLSVKRYSSIPFPTFLRVA